MQSVVLPVISAITAGVLIIGQAGLLVAVAQRRRASRQALGDGDTTLQRLVRRHGNFAENAAIFVASLALLEMMGAARPFVIGLAALFIVGRLLHAIGLSRPDTVNGWRIAGVFATVTVAVVMGVRLVTLGVSHLG